MKNDKRYVPIVCQIAIYSAVSSQLMHLHKDLHAIKTTFANQTQPLCDSPSGSLPSCYYYRPSKLLATKVALFPLSSRYEFKLPSNPYFVSRRSNNPTLMLSSTSQPVNVSCQFKAFAILTRASKVVFNNSLAGIKDTILARWHAFTRPYSKHHGWCVITRNLLSSSRYLTHLTTRSYIVHRFNNMQRCDSNPGKFISFRLSS